MKRNILIILIAISLVHCRREPKDMDFLIAEIPKLGYTGKIERPAGHLQKAALSFMGIEDLITYNESDQGFAIVKFKSSNEKDIYDRVGSLMGFMEGFMDDNDKQELHKAEKILKEQSRLVGNMFIIWQEEEPRDIVRLIERNF